MSEIPASIPTSGMSTTLNLIERVTQAIGAMTMRDRHELCESCAHVEATRIVRIGLRRFHVCHLCALVAGLNP